jgi:hypothetical protein
MGACLVSRGYATAGAKLLEEQSATSVGVRLGSIVVEALEGHSIDCYNLNVCRETCSIYGAKCFEPERGRAAHYVMPGCDCAV